MTRILVTGSRAWSSASQMRLIIRSVLDEFGKVTLVHGGARGADRLAAQIAEYWGATVEPHAADWSQFGKRAGFIRNQAMVDLGADVMLAFLVDPSISKCAGTRDCAARAKSVGIPVRWYAQGQR